MRREPFETLFCLIILLFFGGLLLRCAFYGVHTPDESFYLTVPFRIFQGDKLIIDEFQESQFTAFLQYLPMAVFIRMTGSTDGVILFFRLLFVFCQTAISCFVFFKMKRFGVPCALCSAVLFLVYVPEFVESLDYYTMSLMPLALIAVILFASDAISLPVIFFTGVLFACAVLSQPMLALVYFAYTAVVIVRTASKKKKNVSEYLSVRFWGCVTCGIVFSAVLFLCFLLYRAPLSEYITNIGNLFSGYNHVLPFTSGQKSDILQFGVLFQTLNSLHPVAFPLSIALTAGLLIDRRRISHRTVWCFVLGGFYTYYVIYALARLHIEIAQGMFSPYILFVFTLHCYLLTDRKNKKLLYIWLSGLVYVVCLGTISHALKYAGAVGCSVSNIACAPIAKDLLLELREDFEGKPVDRAFRITKTAGITMTAVCVLSVVGITALNAAALFVSDRVDANLKWDKEPVREAVTSGPLKGITVSKGEKEVYDRITEDIAYIQENAPGTLYIEGQLPTGYLMSGSRFGTCSAYYVDKPEFLNRYYSNNPDRIPDAVYFPTDDMFTDNAVHSLMINMFLKDYDKTRPLFSDYTRVRGKAGYILISPETDKPSEP